MIKLSEIPTVPPEDTDRDEVEAKTEALTKRLAELQHLLYAQGKYSVLVVLQGMDASGKDGATRQVFGSCSPVGIDVTGFKKPTEEEMAHDFLWRIHKHTPRRGMIQIFNRSHYEDVLIQRVNKWITEEHALRRIESINAFEKLLQYDNDTLVLKFYLHLSREEQEEELRERFEDPEKHWKHNPNDWKEAAKWDEYMRCYEDLFARCEIPWHIIPVGKRWYRNYRIAKIVVEEMEKLDLQLPSLEPWSMEDVR